MFDKSFDLIVDFIKRNHIELVASFDFDGRFQTDGQLQLFMTNVDRLTKVGIKVRINFVLTRAAIQMLVDKNSTKIINAFNDLYVNHDVFLEYYTNMHISKYDISEKELGIAII